MTPHPPAGLLQWQRVELLVQQWLSERQQLLRMLNQLRLGCRAQPAPSLLGQQLQAFCQLLIDYISAGYFEVYHELADQARHLRGSQPSAVATLLRRLDDSTDAALRFNDDFDDAQAHLLGNPARRQAMIPTLSAQLAALTEKLEERFALEDQLIVSIHRRDLPETERQTAMH